MLQQAADLRRLRLDVRARGLGDAVIGGEGLGALTAGKPAASEPEGSGGIAGIGARNDLIQGGSAAGVAGTLGAESEGELGGELPGHGPVDGFEARAGNIGLLLRKGGKAL